MKKVAIQEQEEAEQMASWHAETQRELENQLWETAKCHEQLLKQKHEEHEVSRLLLEAQEELMAEAGEQEQAHKLKEELSEQKAAAHTVTEELAEAQRTLMEETARQSSETHRLGELAEMREHREQQERAEMQELKEQHTKQLQDQEKAAEELRKAEEEVQSEIKEQQMATSGMEVDEENNANGSDPKRPRNS